MPVFLWAFAYFTALYFVGSNIAFLLVSMFFLLVLYIALHDLRQAMFYMFIASLPFAKGKVFEIILIHKEQMPQFGLFDIGYYFPLYPSLLFLCGLIYLIFRNNDHWRTFFRSRAPALSFIAFILIACMSMFRSPFPLVIGLTAVQLLLMLSVFLLPYWLKITDTMRRHISHILAAFVIFETGWVLLQVLHRGPLGRYIESLLLLNRWGVLSTEDKGLMRFSGTFFEPSILGTFMLMHLAYFALLLITEKQLTRKERILYLITTACSLVSIIFTGSRGIYGLLVIASFVLFRLHMRSVIKQIAKIVNPRIIIISSLVILLAFLPYVATRIQTIPALFIRNGSGSFRIQLNTLAFRLGITQVFGVGLNLSPYYFIRSFPQELTNDPAHPHNIFFQILAEAGLPGLFMFIVFLWLLYRRYVINPSPKAEPYLFSSILFLLAAQFYPIFISQPEILSYFFLHAGLMSWALENKKQ